VDDGSSRARGPRRPAGAGFGTMAEGEGQAVARARARASPPVAARERRAADAGQRAGERAGGSGRWPPRAAAPGADPRVL